MVDVVELPEKSRIRCGNRFVRAHLVVDEIDRVDCAAHIRRLEAWLHEIEGNFYSN
jgi:hypothetical protein